MTLLNASKSKELLKILSKAYPKPKCALNNSNPLEILVSTILSAQCTDVRVNIVTKSLFEKYKTVKDYANANQAEFEQAIKSTGFYRNKAKNIIFASKMLIQEFGGKVPKTMPELITLPGVARKTANIVLSEGYGIAEGIAVDTHVIRLSFRMGLTKNKDPVKIEKDLMAIVPKDQWGAVSMRLITHGRTVCDARQPKCSICVFNKLCPKNGVKKSA